MAATDLRLANHCRLIRVSRRVGLVEQDRAGGPAVGKGEPVQLVEDAGEGRGGESGDGERAEVMLAQTRFEPAGQWLVDQDRVEIHGRLGHAHALAAGRDRRMEIGQRLAVIEPADFRH
jgi:hypothetical protein